MLLLSLPAFLFHPALKCCLPHPNELEQDALSPSFKQTHTSLVVVPHCFPESGPRKTISGNAWGISSRQFSRKRIERRWKLCQWKHCKLMRRRDRHQNQRGNLFFHLPNSLSLSSLLPSIRWWQARKQTQTLYPICSTGKREKWAQPLCLMHFASHAGEERNFTLLNENACTSVWVLALCESKKKMLKNPFVTLAGKAVYGLAAKQEECLLVSQPVSFSFERICLSERDRFRTSDVEESFARETRHDEWSSKHAP